MSNDTYQVQVPEECSRTGKKFFTSLVLDEVPAHVAREKAKAATAEALTELLTSSEGVPDLVIMWKGQCHVLNTVHGGSDAAVSRYINNILKKDVYDVPEPRTRKAKGDSEDDGESEEAAAASEKPKRGRGKKAAVEAADDEPSVDVDVDTAAAES